MKQLLIGTLILLLLYLPFNSIAQTAIGMEAGVNLMGDGPNPDNVRAFRSIHPGLDVGFFIEKDIKKKIAIRTSLLYSLRFFLSGNYNPNFANSYRAMHCITLPVLASFKANSKLSFDVGVEFITIVATDLAYFSTLAIHLGPKAAFAYQINPVLALRLYGVYDLIKTRSDNAPNSINLKSYNSITLGLTLAYTFKRIKKRRVIRSPG
jgi:hypothetical protein